MEKASKVARAVSDLQTSLPRGEPGIGYQRCGLGCGLGEEDTFMYILWGSPTLANHGLQRDTRGSRATETSCATADNSSQ